MGNPHVTLVNVKNNPITHLATDGIVTADGTVHSADIIAIATGFDSLTGGFKEMDISGLNGVKLSDKWRYGTYTYLGVVVAPFPNMFIAYGPQSPAAYVDGPSFIEPEVGWLVQVMQKMREQESTFVNADKAGELEWKKEVAMPIRVGKRWIHGVSGIQLLSSSHLKTKTPPDMGTNVPGKPREALNYSGEMPDYLR